MFNQRDAVFAHGALLGQDDAVLLCGDAVYALPSLELEQRLYALDEDVQARNLTASPSVHLIDYVQFVALCTEYDRVGSW